MKSHHWLALGVSALLVGSVVVFVLPFGSNLLDKVQEPTTRKVLDNRIVQIGIIGGIVLIGTGIFFSIARALKLPTA
jgi:hypothetical protein